MVTRCLGCMENYDNDFGLCPNCGYEPDASVESPIHMQPGVILHGRYLIGKVLGFGGFGVTYIGWDFTLEQKVAIKEYLPSEFATRLVGQTQVSIFGGKKEEQFGDGMNQFVEEAKRLAQFQNEEGVVRIYDSFAENNTAYIVMEYLDGETLTAYLERNGKIPMDEAVEMLTPVLASLEIIHKAGIIHRDIAPDNIFLTKDGKVKLIDFGAARYATTSHSRSLTVIIKPGYSPEEQYRSRGDQGPHTDVYAIGAVLYRMITGIVLPDSMERRACFEKNGKDIVVPASKNCKISKNQENALMNALNVRVEDRTPTAAQFLEELTTSRRVARIFGRIKVTDLMRWPLWAKILIPAAGVLLIMLTALLAMGVIGPKANLQTDVVLSETEARVPNIVNYSLDVAQNRLAEQGLKCTIVGAEYSDVIPGNMVIHQDTSAGQVVNRDTSVDIYISYNEGGNLVEKGTMPYVVYKTESAAVEILESIGLKVNVEKVYDNIVGEGLVVAQSMKCGEAAAEGKLVTIEISKGVDPDRQEASSELVMLSRDGYDLYVGDSVKVYAEGGDGKYSYQSSDSAVVTVNRNGELTAVGKGSATITVSSGDAESATCTIVVNDYEMAFDQTSLELFAGGSGTLTVTGIPSYAVVTWSSSDPAIAEVNENGIVTGVADGTAMITATWDNDGRIYTAEVEVKVEAKGITLNVYKITSFYAGETRTIEATTAPADQKVTWTSSNVNVVKVNDNGVVTAVGGGTATITASFEEFSAVCEVTVIQPGVSINKRSVSLLVGDGTTLSASVTPSGTSVSWSSDNTGVATVSGGRITAVGSGSTTIRARMTFGGRTYESTCTVSVSTPSVSVNKSSASIYVGDSTTVSASTNPGGLSVSWSSDNTGIATVSGGKIVGVGAGTTVIRAKISYGGKTYQSSCEVTVSKPSVSLSSESISLIIGQSITITASPSPSGASVSWSSSNNSVATVSGGKITAVANGTATITATVSYNGVTSSKTCNVTVEKPSITVTSSSSNITYAERVEDRGTCTLTATVKPDGGNITWYSSDESVAKVSGNGKTATVTAISSGSATITATYKVAGTEVSDSCTISVSKAPSNLVVVLNGFPTRGSLYDFYLNGYISSNYALDRIEMYGTARSNALGISVSDTPSPYYFPQNTYYSDTDDDFRDYVIAQYETLYNLYVGIANILGADDSLTMTATGTVYDKSGASYSITISYVLDE